MKQKQVVLVGAGIVNLVTAYFLIQEGFELVIIEKAPAPEQHSNWKELGCTFGGENVRMYTYTEADNYNEKGSQLYSKMKQAFSKEICDGGWLVKGSHEFSDWENSWVRDFKSVRAEDAKKYCADIYRINIESGALWNEMMENNPELFEDVEVRKDIFRIYSDPADFEAAKKLHGGLGSMIKALDTQEVLAHYPHLQHAAEQNHLGGCMLVNGFTLKVHSFCNNLIQFLTARGAEFRWKSCFSGIERNAFGHVSGIWVDGVLEQYDNYVLSLGAYAGTSLLNTHTHNQIHGVLGVWMTLPNLYPELKYSMKIHKTGHVGEDTNVTLIEKGGKPVLVLGSGYGYTGNADGNFVENSQLKDLFESVKHTAQVYFPEAYEMVSSTVDAHQKYCVRPWTPTGLGIFEVIEAKNGGQLIITGGNNTGGFTQAPQIGEAVRSALGGISHPMHTCFHPRRMVSPQLYS